MPRRGKGWCAESIDLMLDQIQQYLPAGRNGWDKVAEAYNASAVQFPVRDVDSLRRKFAQLKNHLKPTGSPSCPDDVRRAKHISRDIDNSVGVLSMEDENNLDDEIGYGRVICVNCDLMRDVVGSDLDDTVTQDTQDVEQEKPNRTGLGRSALADLSSELKRKRASESTGALAYVARKRQSLDKYIEGAAEADEKATSDWMTIMMMLDARTAEREDLREQREREWRTQENIRQEKALEVQRAREDRREEMHMLLLTKLIEKK